VPPPRLAFSELLSAGTIVGLVAAVATLSAVALTGRLAPLFALGPVVLGFVMPPVRRFAVHFELTVAESPDGLRIRQGLLETRAQTVPPGRVQAVRVVRPLLWRLVGDWVRVEVNVAGYAGQSGDGAITGVLLPVAPAAAARDVLARVLPGVDLDAVALAGVPSRARLVDPLVWTRLAAGADDAVFVARRGLLRRELDVIPHAKPQSMRLTQGPLQRRQRLVTLHLDTTPGPVRVHAAHRDADEALRLLLDVVERSRLARRAQGRNVGWPAPSSRTAQSSRTARSSHRPSRVTACRPLPTERRRRPSRLELRPR
jgi:putative membrane protein